MSTKKKSSCIVNEPSAQYAINSSNNTVHFFNSIDEQEVDNCRYLASLSPEQHLKNATALIKRIFVNDIKQNKSNPKHIIFDK